MLQGLLHGLQAEVGIHGGRELQGQHAAGETVHDGRQVDSQHAPPQRPVEIWVDGDDPVAVMLQVSGDVITGAMGL